jgi:eukaryotic-like serine/threonine-protein kinase
MAITIGQQLGSYEITALLGKGGMGEVYRARDTKLKREVAIKILSPEFSLDADRLSRFQREAEVLANHPNSHNRIDEVAVSIPHCAAGISVVTEFVV